MISFPSSPTPPQQLALDDTSTSPSADRARQLWRPCQLENGRYARHGPRGEKKRFINYRHTSGHYCPFCVQTTPPLRAAVATATDPRGRGCARRSTLVGFIKFPKIKISAPPSSGRHSTSGREL